MFFDNAFGLLRVGVISVLAYVALVAVVRLAGKRSLAKFNAFDLVVTVAFGSTLATVLLTKDIALFEGVLAFAMLALLQWTAAWLSTRWTGLGGLIRSRPRLMVQDGRYRFDAMDDERVTRPEIDAAIRGAGVGRLGEVEAVVLETDGSLSVLPRADLPPDVMDDVRGWTSGA